MKSEVKSRSPIFYVEVKTDNAGSVVLTDEYTERALYLVSGNLRIDGEIIEEGEMLIFKAGATTTIQSLDASRFMLLGGEPLEEERTVWWNFVSSRKDRIEQAKLDWKQNRFKAVPGDPEFIPLPKD
jgi:redox-sensitive bicupin YhaK (pirin superfamily)